jgi:predicted nuclease of predicted toxin-antitoxin system
MLRFLIDTQLPPKLSNLLNQWGYDSLHTTDFPDGHLLNDKAIQEIAVNDNRIIVTKDPDFFDFFHVKGSPPAVLLLTMGNISNNNLFNQLKKYSADIEKLFLSNSVFVIFDGENLISHNAEMKNPEFSFSFSL